MMSAQQPGQRCPVLVARAGFGAFPQPRDAVAIHAVRGRTIRTAIFIFYACARDRGEHYSPERKPRAGLEADQAFCDRTGRTVADG